MDGAGITSVASRLPRGRLELWTFVMFDVTHHNAVDIRIHTIMYACVNIQD